MLIIIIWVKWPFNSAFSLHLHLQSCFPLIMDPVTTNANITLGAVVTLFVLAVSWCTISSQDKFLAPATTLYLTKWGWHVWKSSCLVSSLCIQYGEKSRKRISKHASRWKMSVCLWKRAQCVSPQLFGVVLSSLMIYHTLNTSNRANTPLSVPVMFINQPPAYQHLYNQSE